MIANVDTYNFLGTLDQEDLDAINNDMPIDYWTQHKDNPEKLQEWLDGHYAE